MMAALLCLGGLGGARIRRVAVALIALVSVLLVPDRVGAQPTYGSFGPEGPRMREQLWIVPGGDPETPLRATVFKPADDGTAVRRPLVVINHGSDASTREAVSMPVFYWLSRWFVARGYVVLVPQRRGHGATGGDFAEGRDSCSRPDHWAAAQTAADDIEAAVRFMSQQPFIDDRHVVVAGTSTGGWASLAVAGRSIPGVQLVVNFAGGRGGHAYGRPHAICAKDRLIETAGRLGERARIPTVWFYARNDSYFGPQLADAMAAAWQKAGGRVNLKLLPAYGADGHELVADRASWPLWETELARHLAEVQGLATKEIAADADLLELSRAPLSPASAGRQHSSGSNR
jgi:dienelactone hydrolase